MVVVHSMLCYGTDKLQLFRSEHKITVGHQTKTRPHLAVQNQVCADISQCTAYRPFHDEMQMRFIGDLATPTGGKVLY